MRLYSKDARFDDLEHWPFGNKAADYENHFGGFDMYDCCPSRVDDWTCVSG